jgi:hypothetical protein
MAELRQIEPGYVESHEEPGRKAARLIWNDGPEVEDI